MKIRNTGIVSAVSACYLLLAAASASAQSRVPQGEHQRATNDPVFVAQELLGRPTATAITVNAAARRNVEAYYEYGNRPGSYTGKTPVTWFAADQPMNVLIDRLQPDTLYYYRMQYREPGASGFTARAEHSFHTQRKPGSEFTFVMQFDPHLDAGSDEETYKLTLKNMLADKPDFMVDVGDNLFTDRLRPHSLEGVHERALLNRSYYDLLNHSAALFFGLGNHEGEWGSPMGPKDDLPLWDSVERKRYFPNPEPNGFYSGSSRNEPGIGLRQANFAWEWGDALFVMLDPYWNTPAATEQAGDWFLTLGREQYDWLKKTLETSKAKYKFVFAHNLIGGKDMDGIMRGGIEVAKYLEWGGYNLDDTWGFDKARPGWPMPIHQLLVANHVSAFFHGHDHTYAKQDLDGIVYQEGPQPSARGTELGDRGTKYNYTHGTVLGGVGYIRARVGPNGVKVDYVQTWVPSKENASQKNGMVADSYVIKPYAAKR